MRLLPTLQQYLHRWRVRRPTHMDGGHVSPWCAESLIVSARPSVARVEGVVRRRAHVIARACKAALLVDGGLASLLRGPRPARLRPQPCRCAASGEGDREDGRRVVGSARVVDVPDARRPRSAGAEVEGELRARRLDDGRSIKQCGVECIETAEKPTRKSAQRLDDNTVAGMCADIG